jgi:hypothetical protein
MIVAKEKFKTNIVEYLIYMFQVEDMIRACKFDETIIANSIITRYKVEPEIRKQIKEWYYELAESLKSEGKQKEGHLSYLLAKTQELYDFHLYLLQDKDHGDYQNAFRAIYPQVEILKEKKKDADNDIALLLESVYGLFLLKLQQKEISEGTLQSVQEISGVLALLANKFKAYEAGEITIE